MNTKNLDAQIEQLAWIAGGKASSSIHLLKKQYFSILAKKHNLAEINSKEMLFRTNGPEAVPVLLSPGLDLESKTIKFNELYEGHPLLIDNRPELEIALDIKLEHNQNFIATTSAYEKFLSNKLPWLATMTSSLIDLFVPAYLMHHPELNFSISGHNFKGALFIKLRQILELNFVSLAHETAHQMLMIYLLSDPVIISDHKDMIYSAARNEKRQAIRSLHSLFAVTYEILAQAKVLESKIFSHLDVEKRLQDSLEQNVKKFLNNLNDLERQCEFSPLGQAMMKEFNLLSKEFTLLLATESL